MIFFRRADSSENGLVPDVQTICAVHSSGHQGPDQLVSDPGQRNQPTDHHDGEYEYPHPKNQPSPKARHLALWR